ncbi:MAG: hypothetical protein RBT76_14990 [candidate division Zixibacteria bacterium]|jgi:hypothetical protein|nr:hypothetical protein [candidate division Zixibacteria bacterium]
MKKQDEGFSWSKRVKATLTLLLVTVFARYDPFGLRHQALQRLKSILGDRYRELRKSAHPSVGWSILSSVWTWVVFVPALLAVAVHLTGIVPRHLVLPREVVSESLSLVSPIPLSLVGLVIPFLALAVSVVYSKMGTGAVAYVMKNNRVVRIVYAALSILGLLLILRFSLAIAASVIGDQATLRLVLNVGWLVAFMSVWWVLLLIVLAGIGVSSVLAA